MGCCENVRQIEETHEKLIISVLTSFPLCQFNSKYCLSQFNSCEKEYNSNRKQFHSKKTNTVKEYYEDKYYQVIESLYNVKYTSNLKDRKTDRVNLKSKESIQIDSSVNQQEASAKPIGSLYLAVSPDYNNLFDSIIKNKPKGSYALFIMGFTKESLPIKIEHFLRVFEYSDMSPNIINFQIILQAYAMINLSFSLKLFDWIQSNKSKMFYDEINREFHVKLDSNVMDQWMNYNRGLLEKRSDQSMKFSIHYSKMLYYILSKEVTEEEFESHKENLINIKVGDEDPEDILNEFRNFTHYEFNETDINLLTIIEPNLFDFALIRPKLNSFGT